MGGDHSGGGSLTLADFIDKHGEELVGDFLQYYNVRLSEIVSEGSTWTPLEVLVLIRQLPVESRTVAVQRGGDQFRGWGVERYMFATLIDAVNQVAYITAAANSKRKPKAPKPFPRPKKNRTGGSAPDNPFKQRIQAVKRAKGG